MEAIPIEMIANTGPLTAIAIMLYRLGNKMDIGLKKLDVLVGRRGKK